MSEALLKVEGLSAGYDEMAVLHDIDFVVYPGEIVTLVGSNGAGKTTLLRVLSRVLAGRGKIEFSGNDLMPLTSEQAFVLGLVHVPEGRQLFERMSIEDNLLLGAYHCSDRRACRRRLEHVQSLFPVLYERRNQIAGYLSGGEQQMCALARALMAEPKLLMIDEMSLGLAPVIVDKLLGVLAEIRRDGVTVLLVEQDVYSAFRIADRGYVLENGEIVRYGPAHELAEDPEVKQAYLGL